MSIEQVADELFDYVITPMTGVPTAVKTQLRDTMRPRYHGHIGVVMAVEIIYRNRATLPVAALNLGAKLAEEAGESGLGGLQVERRGVRIGAAIRKLPGVEAKPAADTSDPVELPEG